MYLQTAMGQCEQATGDIALLKKLDGVGPVDDSNNYLQHFVSEEVNNMNTWHMKDNARKNIEKKKENNILHPRLAVLSNININCSGDL